MKAKGTLFEQLQQVDDQSVGTIHNQWKESKIIQVLIIIFTVLICGLFFPNTISYVFKSEQNISTLLGLPWQYETVRAEYSFPISKSPEVLQDEVKAVRETTPLVFTVNNSNTTNISTSRVRTLEVVDSLSKVNQFMQSSEFKNDIMQLVNSIITKGYINITRSTITTNNIIVSLSNTESFNVASSTIYDKDSVTRYIQNLLKKYSDENTYNQFVSILLKQITPNYIYSQELSTIAKYQAESNVRKTKGIVRKGEVVIEKGEIVNEELLTKMKSYGLSGTLNFNDKSPSIFSIIGAILHSGLVYSILILFLAFLRKKIFSNNAALTSISLMIIIVALFSWLSLRINSTMPLEYLIIIPTFSMLSAIFFDSRTGFTVTVTMALMLAGVRGNDYSTGFAMLLAGTLGAYSVRDLQSRTQIFRSLGLILIGFITVIVTFKLERNLSLYTMYYPLLSSAINAVASPILTFGVIAIMEKYLKVSTDLQLQEYDNLNHPLLNEMNEKAPGTYQHTLSIANLVETAAYSIGANPLLARVGAYFHDIGKIPKAEYFIENQIEMTNKHDHLSPTKSASIIRNHVEDGIELAKEYKLPQRIIDFIPMHHGTTLIKHFYAKAHENLTTNEEIDDTLFRYPGPKPNSKETAILMLADSVEAVSRTVEDREDMEVALDKIFKDKILDGQLDESELTMKELQEIKLSFLKNLVGVQHQRIQYKEVREN